MRDLAQTLGPLAFGKDAWNVIKSLHVCHPSTHPLFDGDFNAWSNPDPCRGFLFFIAFAIQWGNVRPCNSAELTEV